MRRIVEVCRTSGARIRTIPGMDHLIEGRVQISQIRNVAIEDLLGREPVQLDTQLIAEHLNGRVVMVTGAGGSIGAELCRQVARFGPARLVLVEQAENALFQIHRELQNTTRNVSLVPVIADICDSRRMERVFAEHKPTAVFHAAAHKHVPMMEWNPGEAIKNNAFGTKKLADLSDRYGVREFVMISTDKAVNPTSIMGVSKRVAEIYCQALSQRSKTRFITVRFGNVLGSNGSVVPIFQEQIAHGGPVTVTHPEMKRYFMTIPEACQLVMQAGAMGTGGEIFVLDMGEPVKIVDLARDLITLSGLRPGEDIEIQFTGIRPGEKLFEELAADEERADKTRHPKIFVGRFRPYEWDAVEQGMVALHENSEGRDDALIRAAFARLVPEYRPTIIPGGASARERANTGSGNVIALKR
jgi:FlaA1/EpsC-like NDP-sugar epimerase